MVHLYSIAINFHIFSNNYRYILLNYTLALLPQCLSVPHPEYLGGGGAAFLSLVTSHGGMGNFEFYKVLEQWKQPFLDKIYIKLTVSIIMYTYKILVQKTGGRINL